MRRSRMEGLKRTCKRWWPAIAVAGLLLAAMRPVSAEAPADPDLDQRVGDLITLLPVAPTMGPFIIPAIEGKLHFYQSLLRMYQLEVDDALLTAWTTQSLLDMDRSLHQSVAASRYTLQKLQDDIAWYEEEYSSFTLPGYTPESAAKARAFDKYKKLKEFVAKYGPGITSAGDNVLQVFTDVRQRLARGAYGAPSLRLDSGRIAEALYNYQREMSVIEQAVQDEVYNQRLTPEQQLRLTFVNESPDLIFFVRLWERDQAGEYPAPREDTQRWVPIYPNGSRVPLDTTQGGQTVQTVQTLPSETWAPAKLRDKLEVRVATFGETRQRIRFMNIPLGGQVRPELTALSRGFYFFGYRVDQGAQYIISHWYPVDESYTWEFQGAWGVGSSARDPEFVPTDLKEWREEERYPVTLNRDHLVWYLPASFDSVKGDPDAVARVTGKATFNKKGPTSRSPIQELKETGTGAFTMTMEPF